MVALASTARMRCPSTCRSWIAFRVALPLLRLLPSGGGDLWKGFRAVGVFSDSVWMCTDGLAEDKASIASLEAYVPSKGITHWALIAALHKVLKACKAKTDSSPSPFPV